MADHLIQLIVAKFGIESRAITELEGGYRNKIYKVGTDAGDYTLIIYKSDTDILMKINSAHVVANLLAKENFPVRVPKSKVLKISGETINKYAVLYNYLPGDTIPWEGYNRRHIKLLGKTLSDMHATLSSEGLDLPAVTIELKRILEDKRKYFTKSSVRKAMKEKLDLQVSNETLDYFSRLIESIETLSTQPLHMDFVRSNVLFSGPGEDLRISGILDFEKAASGAAITDVARTLAFLIVDCKYKPEDKVRKYFLHSGYEKKGGSKLRDLKYLEHLLNFFWFYDFYKFLLHNPYESLKDNEHYLRTVGKLRKRGLVFC